MSDTKIISCFLMGGLGNQLFQIFTTLAYGIRFNRKMVLPYTDVLNVGIDRPTYWESFLSSLKKFTTYNKSNKFSNDDLSKLPQYREPCHHFSKIPKFKDEPFTFFGYFQSYKYFEKEIDTIYALINLREQQELIRKEFPEYFNSSYVNISMHFRLGDYKNIQEYHPIMPYQYYENSLFHIVLHQPFVKPYRLLYFCEKEDNEIVTGHINMLKNKFSAVEFIKVDDSIEDWKQLLIMSCCDNNIIANSSFSWWGSYLNKNETKIVCSPKSWFGPKVNKITDDMFPAHWVKIDC